MEDSEENRRRIFVSYSRKDSEFAKQLSTDLRTRGIQVWFDQLDIPASARWDDEIESALRITTTTLVILSPNSVGSENVRDEINMALNDKDRIIPVLYQPCNIPLRIGRVQYVDFTGDYASAVERLVAECSRLAPVKRAASEMPVHSTPVTPAAQPIHSVSPVATSARPTGRRLSSKQALIAGAALAVLAVVVIVAASGGNDADTLSALRDKQIDQLRQDGLALADVSCPENVEIVHGGSFECTAQVDAVPVKIKLTGTASQDGASVDRLEAEVVGAVKMETLLTAATERYGNDAKVSCDYRWVVLPADAPAHCTLTRGEQSDPIEIRASNATDGAGYEITWPTDDAVEEPTEKAAPPAAQQAQRPAARRVPRYRGDEDNTGNAPTTQGATADYPTEVGSDPGSEAPSEVPAAEEAAP